MEAYKALSGQSRFIGNQPVTFDKGTYDKKVNYFLTHKLDGKRHLLFISKTGVYLITSKMEFIRVKLPSKAHQLVPNTILDMELYKNKYYIFDILFSNGIDFRSKKLSERILEIDSVVNKIKSKKIIIKPYLSPYISSTFENFIKLKTLYKKEMETGEVDGIIFTPDSGYKEKVLKWKPLNLLSIDFKVKKLPANTLALLLQNGELFSPKQFPNSGIVSVSKIWYSKIKDGEVVEFIFKDNRFVPLRIRKDKIKSNYISVILSNFREITHPTDILKILK